MANRAQQLKDLDVDRVDGVDKPATGRGFLMFKSEDGDAIMKGYGMVATAADAVLKALRKDSKAVMSRKSAIALNGLAQVLGQDAVVVGKSVPTQPYMFSEPDVDTRGPADEDLSANFTPRSMPGSMVGSVSFRMKDEDEDEAKSVTAAKSKAKAKDEDADEAGEDEMDASDKANRGIARSMEKMADAITKQSEILGQLIGGVAKVAKSTQVEETEEVEPVRKSAPRSRQVESDDDREEVRKDGRVGFGNIIFPKQ